jgi:hypothetical protein
MAVIKLIRSRRGAQLYPIPTLSEIGHKRASA